MENSKIPEVTIDTFDEFVQHIKNEELIKTKARDMPDEINIIINPVIGYGRYFRGVEKASYDLSSTLERYIKRYYNSEKYHLSKAEFDEIAKEFLDKCKETLKSKIPEKFILLNEEYENEIWYYGQHYGLSTPFLDWSKSFFVALYFAFENYKVETEYRAVYSLNTNSIGNHIEIYEPNIDLGGRLTAQKGVFTRMLSEELENINALSQKPPPNLGIKEALTKVLIKDKLRGDILEYLYYINIDSATIYPDILGAIKSSHLALDNILEYMSFDE